MKKKELFDRTVGILVKAYHNDTLAHCNCYACAVGNIIAGNMGINYSKDDRASDSCHMLHWSTEKNAYVHGSSMYKLWHSVIQGGGVYYDYMNASIEAQIKSTGYSARELAKIEESFEDSEPGFSDESWMFNGLMAVLDCLMNIHEANEAEVKQAKELFVRL